MFEMFMMVIFPYICMILLIVGLIINIKSSSLRISAPATGFFESKKLFWASVPWHYGILIVLIGHLLGLLFPSYVMELTSSYQSRVIFEVVALSCGFSALFGLMVMIYRRLFLKTISKNTKMLEIFILLLLCAQIVLGIIIAISYRWGISWYTSNLSKYFYDLITFSPTVKYVQGLPLLVELHIIGAFTILAVLPFTKLIHLIYVPITYLFRKPQIIVNYDSEK